MAMDKYTRFSVSFEQAFPQGAALVGEISPDNEFQQDRTRPARQRVDEATGRRQWKGVLTDPSAVKPKDANVSVTFLADVQPVPTTEEFMPGCGIRPAVLEGLQVRPKVTGNGEYKSLGWEFYATGFAESSSAGRSAAITPGASGGGSGGASGRGKGGAEGSGAEGKAA
ncbi:MAG: hypothetical protein ACRDRL_03960 [Sciscionella sp.]